MTAQLLLDSTGLCRMDATEKQAKRSRTRSSASVEHSPKKSKGTPVTGVDKEETPGSGATVHRRSSSSAMQTPVQQRTSLSGTPLSGAQSHPRGSDQGREGEHHVRIVGVAQGSGGGRGQGSGGVRGQGSSGGRRQCAEETARHSGSVERSVHGVSDVVPLVDYKDKFWMLDWAGDIGQDVSGLLLFVVLREQLRPVGGIASWVGRDNQFATFELTMLLNDKGQRVPDANYVVVRWSNHKGYASTTIVPKAGQIASKGPAHAQVPPPAPKKIRGLAAKKPLDVLHDIVRSSSMYGAAVQGHEEHSSMYGAMQRHEKPLYFKDSEEGSSEEGTEREDEEEGSQERSGGSQGEEKEDSGQTFGEREGHEWTQAEELERRRHSSVHAGLCIERKEKSDDEHSEDVQKQEEGWHVDELQHKLGGKYEQERRMQERRKSVEEETTTSSPAVTIEDKKRKARQERRKSIDQKRSRKEQPQKRQVQPLPMDEAVQRTCDAKAAAKQKPTRKKRVAKGGTMEKTAVFPASEQPQCGDEGKGKTVTRP
ncbi:hypothetical protein CBR_g38823 [Chara braunii]|uniref:Uncharacterized protein n=1 Tax=Chara braunii TaxID=69332 RepID=A0A388LQJ3_CHABU|nr:hypothetical protein CBR_g38823 [Chara braunii]|eukprot:GBG84541.1 hypothetical protein CBR_g38823 [Chara braunii]